MQNIIFVAAILTTLLTFLFSLLIQKKSFEKSLIVGFKFSSIFIVGGLLYLLYNNLPPFPFEDMKKVIFFLAVTIVWFLIEFFLEKNSFKEALTHASIFPIILLIGFILDKINNNSI